MSKFQFEINGKKRIGEYREALYALQMIGIETEFLVCTKQEFSFRLYLDGVELFNNYEDFVSFLYKRCNLVFTESGNIVKEVDGKHIPISGREGFNEYYNMDIEIEVRGALRVLYCSVMANFDYMQIAG